MIDLSNMKANYEKNGVLYRIAKMDNTDTTPYLATRLSDELGRWLSRTELASYTPLPGADPEYVTLTLDNGETVRCEFVKTHTGRFGNPYMLLACRASNDVSIRKSAVAIEQGATKVDRSDLDWFTPFPSPESAKDKAVREIQSALDKVDKAFSQMILTREKATEIHNDLKQAIELLKEDSDVVS